MLVSNSTNPYVNLATEEWLFRDSHTALHTLYLWRNEPTVVIGRHQNPFKECNLKRMEEEGIHLVRRYSGGGAVYQDLGNSIFTFISHRPEYCKEKNTEILVEALRRFGIEVVVYSAERSIIWKFLTLVSSVGKTPSWPPRVAPDCQNSEPRGLRVLEIVLRMRRVESGIRRAVQLSQTGYLS